MSKDKPREPMEIKIDLIEFLFSFGPQKATRIGRACNLRDDVCKEYLAELNDLQFITKSEANEYGMMEKGVQFLGQAIELYKLNFPSRRKEIEESRFWKPIRRVTVERERQTI